MRFYHCFLILLLSCLILIAPAQQQSVVEQSKDELLRSADELLKEVSALRGLPIKQPVRKGIKSKDDIRKYVTKRIREEYPAEDLLAEQKTLVKLGLIPKDLNLEQTLLDLYTEQIAGYYDPTEKMFYIADWMPVAQQKPIMVHELTHALQDQHFDLAALTKRAKNNDDMSLARAAVIEGDGLAVMLDYLLKPEGLSFTSLPNIGSLMGSQLGALDQFKVFSAAPEYLKQVLMFPYLYGLSFLQAYRKKYSWKEMAKVYLDTPKSTEQIMHPEKYIQKRDDPIPVEIAYSPEALKDWKEIYSNVLGEFTMYTLVNQFTKDATLAKTASEGWGGDRVKSYRNLNTGGLLLIVLSTWDTEKDAVEFFDAYKQVIESKYNHKQAVESKPGKSYVWKTEEDHVLLERDKSSVLIVEGASKDLVIKFRIKS